MTPEEAVEYYNMEQRNYYEYCSYIQNYQNRIGELQSERQNKNILADEKQTEIQRNQDLYVCVVNRCDPLDEKMPEIRYNVL